MKRTIAILPPAVALLSAGTVVAKAPAKAGEKKTNVVLIMCDDTGYECFGAMGGTYSTPNLDRLAAEGKLFTRAYSTPLSTPSRVQLMTGKYNHKNYTEFGYLDPREKTFGNLAKQVGYATCIAGKWQLGANYDYPHHFGFDTYALWHIEISNQVKRKPERYSAPSVIRDGVKVPTDRDDYGPDIFCRFITDFITDNKDKPFVAYYPMVLSHGPFVPTPSSGEWASIENRYAKDDKYFADMVGYCDMNVGKIVDCLKRNGLWENTVLLFMGDNGTHRALTSTMKDGTQVKGGKGQTTDAGTRTMLVAAGGPVRQGMCGDLVDFTDFMPTIAEIIGAEVPTEWDTDGVSFAPQIKGRKGSPREWTFLHYTPLMNGKQGKNDARYIRDQRYKLYSDGRFYDVETDAHETSSIAVGSGTGKAEKARKVLQAQLDKFPPWKAGDPSRPRYEDPRFPIADRDGAE